MSDEPLFQNTDEQEAAYTGRAAPGTPEAAETGEGVVLPGAAAAGPISGGAISGSMGTTGTAGAIPAAGPEVAGAYHTPEEDRDDDSVLEDGERRSG